MCWIHVPVEEAKLPSLSFQQFSGEEGQESLKPLSECARNFSHLVVLFLSIDGIMLSYASLALPTIVLGTEKV